MDEVLRKIINIDNNAKEIYKSASLRREQILASAREEIRQKELEIKETSDRRIMQLSEQSRKDMDERIGRIQSRVEEKLKFMEQRFLENEQQFVETIFKKVTGD